MTVFLKRTGPNDQAGDYCDIVQRMNEDFELFFTVKDDTVARDLSGYVARMHVREYEGSAGTLLNLSSTDAEITISEADGTVLAQLTPEQMQSAGLQSAGYYDLVLTNDDDVSSVVLKGTFTATRGITR